MLQTRGLLPLRQTTWFAGVVRSLADWLEPPPPPSVSDEVRAAIEEARRELLVAEGMEEEARHTVAWLRERLERLEGRALR